MDGSDFDRIARIFATGISRRSLAGLAGLSAVAGIRPVAAQLKQLTPSTCSASGEVCTHLRGCCDGLTCVTSAINTNYGVCVPGEGGTVSVGTTLLSPFSEEVETEIAALAQESTTTDTTSTTTTTDLEAEREQRIADKKLRKENRRDDQKLRKQTQKNEQQDRREDRKDDRELRRGPKLQVELFNAGDTDPVETVRVTNRDDEDIILNRIDSLPPPGIGTEITNGFRLEPGASFLFLSESEGSGPSIVGNRLRWGPVNPICQNDMQGDGFVISAALSSNSDNQEFAVSCDGSAGDNEDNKRRKKRKKQSNRGRSRGKSKNKNG